MRRSFVLFTVLAAVVVTCGFLSISLAPPSGRTVIRYCQWSGVQQQAVVWEIKKAFERENPDVEVRLEFYTRNFWQKLYTMIAADVAPDVWMMSCPFMIDFARKALLEDLTPLIERDGIDMGAYYETVTRSFQWRGRQYSMPFQFGAIALYYNRDLFDRAGLAYPNTKWVEAPDGERTMRTSPWTWDDLLEAARALTQDTNGDGKPDQFGFFVNAGMESCVSDFIFQAGGEVMDAERRRVTLDTPEAARAVQFLRDMRWIHGVAPTEAAFSTQGLSATDLFETGRIAMSYDGSWRMDYYNRTGSLNYDVAALPAGPDGHRGGVVNGLANGLNAASRHKEAAWRWMKFYAGVSGRNDMTEAVAQRLAGDLKRGIPVVKRIANSRVFLNPNAAPDHESVFLEQMDTAHDMWPAYGWNEWMGEAITPIMRVLLEEREKSGLDVAEALKAATREANALIEGVEAEQRRLDERRKDAHSVLEPPPPSH